jgi:hypothetical protein
MLVQRYSERQVLPNSIIHISLKRPNPPFLENIHRLPINPLSFLWYVGLGFLASVYQGLKIRLMTKMWFSQ